MPHEHLSPDCRRHDKKLATFVLAAMSLLFAVDGGSSVASAKKETDTVAQETKRNNGGRNVLLAAFLGMAALAVAGGRPEGLDNAPQPK